MSTALSIVCPPPARASTLLLQAATALRVWASSGFTYFNHHSGAGGYAKPLLADVLPRGLSRSLLLDTDTLVAAGGLEPLWRLFDAFPSGQAA